MKKMILESVTFFCLILIIGTQLSAQENHCIEVEKNLFCPSVNEGNFEEVMNEIEEYYRMGHEWMLQFNEVEDAIDNLLDDISATADNENCNPGGIELTDKVEIVQGDDKVYEMRFRWPNSQLTELSTLYFAKYLNLLDTSDTGEDFFNPSLDSGSASPGVSLEVPSNYNKKLYVLNANCEITTLSDYFIIIIDRDITRGPLPEPRSEETNNSNTFVNLEVFPNPTFEDNVDLKFDLIKDQKVSIQLLEGSTGKQLQIPMSEQILEKGSYLEKINMNGLTSGIYYVVLQTEENRVVQKIIKTE